MILVDCNFFLDIDLIDQSLHFFYIFDIAGVEAVVSGFIQKDVGDQFGEGGVVNFFDYFFDCLQGKEGGLFLVSVHEVEDSSYDCGKAGGCVKNFFDIHN